MELKSFITKYNLESDQYDLSVEEVAVTDEDMFNTEEALVELMENTNDLNKTTEDINRYQSLLTDIEEDIEVQQSVVDTLDQKESGGTVDPEVQDVANTVLKDGELPTEEVLVAQESLKHYQKRVGVKLDKGLSFNKEDAYNNPLEVYKLNLEAKLDMKQWIRDKVEELTNKLIDKIKNGIYKVVKYLSVKHNTAKTEKFIKLLRSNKDGVVTKEELKESIGTKYETVFELLNFSNPKYLPSEIQNILGDIVRKKEMLFETKEINNAAHKHMGAVYKLLPPSLMDSVRKEIKGAYEDINISYCTFSGDGTFNVNYIGWRKSKKDPDLYDTTNRQLYKYTAKKGYDTLTYEQIIEYLKGDEIYYRTLSDDLNKLMKNIDEHYSMIEKKYGPNVEEHDKDKYADALLTIKYYYNTIMSLYNILSVIGIQAGNFLTVLNGHVSSRVKDNK